MKILSHLVIFFLIFFLAPHRVSAVTSITPTLKIMTYNVREGSVQNEQQGIYKMNKIAQYLKDNNIDIVALQEMRDWSNSTKYGEMARDIYGDDSVWLSDALKKLNYPMYYYKKPYAPKIGLGYANVTFSKYPIVKNGYDDFLITKDHRWAVVTEFDTIIGPLKIINIHTYSKSGYKISLCDQASVIDIRMQSLYSNDRRTVAIGDWNLFLYDPNACFGANYPSRYTFLCNSKDCEEELDDNIEKNIDYGITHKSGDIKLISEVRDKTFPHSDHFPVIATVGLKNNNAVYDINMDGSLTVRDIISLLARNPQNFSIMQILEILRFL